MNKKFLVRYVCLILTGAFIVLAVLYFRGKQDDMGVTENDSHTSVSNELPSSNPGADINDILQQWSAGKTEVSLRNLLQLYDEKAPQIKYRPFDISELRFAIKSSAVRKKMQKEMEARFKILKKFNQDMQSQAKAATAAGDNAKARQILLALKQLGQANTGPEVTLLAGLFGKMIESQADKELALLGEAQSGGTPPP